MGNQNKILNNYYYKNNEYDTFYYNNIKNNRLNTEKSRKINKNDSNESKNILKNNSYFPMNNKYNIINNIRKNDINISNDQIQTKKICVDPINKRNELYKIPKKEQLSYNLKIKKNHSLQMNSIPLTNNSLKRLDNINKNTKFQNKRNYKINYNNEIYNLKIDNYNTYQGYMTKNFNQQSQKILFNKKKFLNKMNNDNKYFINNNIHDNSYNNPNNIHKNNYK